MNRNKAAILAGCSLLGAGGHALAGQVQVEVGQVEFGGVAIEGLQAAWAPAAGAAGRATLRAARVRGIGATGPLSGFALDCPELHITGDELQCDRGRLSGSLGSLGVQNTAFAVRRLADGRLRLAFDSFGIAGGHGRVDVALDGGRWRLESTQAGVDLGRLAVVARPLLELPVDFTIAGRASGTFRATGAGDALRTAGADVAVETLDFSDAGGTLAGEGLAGSLAVETTADQAGSLAARGKIVLTAGQAYSEPLFLDFKAHAADLEFDGRFDTGSARFDADSFSLEHAGVLRAGGSITLDLAADMPLREAKVRIRLLDLATALPIYAQPFLINSSFRDIVGAGTIGGEVEIDGGIPVRAAFQLEDVAIDSETASVALDGVRGHVNWFDDATRSALAGKIDDGLFQSQISWSGGRLWGLELGPAEVPFATTGRNFRLLEPATLPIFDGGLAIDTMRIRHAGTEAMYVRFDAEVRPISISLLSRAFGWPEFQGTLAGRIPGLQLRQGVVTLEGNLEAAVFDGRVVARELSLVEPLGKFPQMHASIDISNLDLALVTRTFSFGMITGRMSGRIMDLEMFNWMPEAFDAFLYTPPDDRSKHRISQRAVTNLSSIGGGSGGGVAAALQGGFLRFFDDFRYDRVGLSCRLANDVCIMGGVEHAPGGYYIVKGAGLPRIDVIGSQTRVAWTTLVRQLGTMMESEIIVK